MTHHKSYRAAPVTVFVAALLMVAMFAFGAPARADNENATTTDGAPGANAGQVIATSTDGTGGLHDDQGGSIETGDATATTNASTTLNINNIDPDGTNDPECSDEDDNDESLPGHQDGAVGVDGPQCSDRVDNDGDDTWDYGDSSSNASVWHATSTNDAVADVLSTSTASTGENVAQGGQATTTIVTGTARAFANIINLINTNIFNSTGLILFLNEMFSTGLDLRNYDLSYFFDGEPGASPTINEETGEPQCTFLTCLNSSIVKVESGNTATVTNTVIVRADAGNNVATTSGDGGAEIATGDAYAGANVVNLVNTNIINSSYLMVAFNNFGDLDGDITLPGGSFFTDLFARGGTVPEMNASAYKISNENYGTSTSDVGVDANTGSSTAETTGEGSGIVATGDAYSQATEYTDLNKNYIGGTSAFFMFRVAGEWKGNFKSLPDGLYPYTYQDVATKDGTTSTSTLVLITNEELDEEGTPEGQDEGNYDNEQLPSTPEANCDEDEGAINNCMNSSQVIASSTNTAVVENNIDVSANTGNNVAITEDGTAHVITGDAYAIANLVNIINTNIVGRNWIFAIFNVLGNWNGDVSFGKSALALTAKTLAPATVAPGAEIAYEFTVTNNGDRDADDITLKADYDKSKLAFTDAEGDSTDSGREWQLDTVRRGESRTFTFPAQVGDVPAGTGVTVPVAVSVLSDGNGSNAEASFTIATVEVQAPATGGGGGGGGGGGSSKSGKIKASNNSKVVGPTSSKNPDISVVKEVVGVSTTTPAVADYKVVITNSKTAGHLYDGKLSDTLYDPAGQVMYERSWDIGAMAAGEQITLTYSVEFPTTTIMGAYRNVASIAGSRLGSGIDGKPFAPVTGEATVTLGGAGLVLGAALDCSLAVTQTLNYGMTNPEVIKLQNFLNAHQGAALPPTGFFGPLTRAAVNKFQSTYAADILAPIGLTYPTGSVAGMTQKKIRSIVCASAAL